MFRKLIRVWSHNSYDYIPKFTQVFPELKHLPYDELCTRWKKLGVTLYTEKPTKISWWIRLTLPFGLLVLLMMFISLPFVYMLTGEWRYPIPRKTWFYNWFKQLKFL